MNRFSKLWIMGLLFVAIGAQAQETQNELFVGALGDFRGEYGDSSTLIPVLEAGYHRVLATNSWGQFGVGGRLSLRPGTIPQPQSFQLKETDLILGPEVAVSTNGAIAPVLSLGAGFVFRATRLVTSGNVTQPEGDPQSGLGLYPSVLAQAAVSFGSSRRSCGWSLTCATA